MKTLQNIKLIRWGIEGGLLLWIIFGILSVHSTSPSYIDPRDNMYIISGNNTILDPYTVRNCHVEEIFIRQSANKIIVNLNK